MKSRFSSYNLDWLTNTPAFRIDADASVERMPMPISPELGKGSMEVQRLTMGMTLFHGIHTFEPAAKGALVPLTAFTSDFPEPTLSVQVATHGQFAHHEQFPKVNLIFNHGNDLFRYGDKVDTQSYLDGSNDSEMTAMFIGRSVLDSILSEESSETLLKWLGLTPAPQALVKTCPIFISNLLRSTHTNKMHGEAKKLFSQAKVVEYLSALLVHSNTEPSKTSVNQKRRVIVRGLHQYLLGLEGALPTLSELSKQHGISVRLLNAEFVKEYGESIYSFLVNHRLNQAHMVLETTNLQMKVLADNLGYSHVNHFITAFKNKFGYSPGTLRK
jgi:AraC-like DNA-binding protein